MEQYTSGHADLLTRVRNLQFRWEHSFLLFFYSALLYTVFCTSVFLFFSSLLFHWSISHLVVYLKRFFFLPFFFSVTFALERLYTAQSFRVYFLLVPNFISFYSALLLSRYIFRSSLLILHYFYSCFAFDWPIEHPMAAIDCFRFVCFCALSLCTIGLRSEAKIVP